MSDSEATPSQDGPVEQFSWWLLFDGGRLVVTSVFIVAVFLLTMALIRHDVVFVGPNSYVPTAFASGIAGIFTLVTVTLTINQLILSRVFGTPAELSDQLEGSRGFRAKIASYSDRSTMPNQPADFIGHVGSLLDERTRALRERNADVDWVAEASEDVEDVLRHADDLGDIDSDEMSDVDVLERLLGSRTARSISTMDRLRDVAAPALSAEDKRDFEAVGTLLHGVAVSRQYYKTLVLQQMLAELSRYVAYFGGVAILTALYVSIIYRTSGGPSVDPQYLDVLVSAATAVCAAPMIVLLAYVLRVATISRYTLSVGPFFPPEERIRN